MQDVAGAVEESVTAGAGTSGCSWLDGVGAAVERPRAIDRRMIGVYIFKKNLRLL